MNFIIQREVRTLLRKQKDTQKMSKNKGKIILVHPEGIFEFKDYKSPLSSQFGNDEVQFQMVPFPKQLKGLYLFMEEFNDLSNCDLNIPVSEYLKSNVFGRVIISKDGRGLSPEELSKIVFIFE